jgi:GLPGLI family protein
MVDTCILNMKWILSLLSFFVLAQNQAQKRFSEGSILFTVSISDNGIKSVGETTLLQKVKGGHYKSELTNEIGKTITIYDLREGTGAILKEFGSQKIMIPLNKVQWNERIQRKDSILFNVTETTKEILGYTCTKAESKGADGNVIAVFFTQQLIPENWDMELQFSTLGGIVLEYESTIGLNKVNYLATNLNFDPVPIQKFDVPQSGYRISSYGKK